MFDDRRELWERLAGHLLAATPFLASTWYLFESTSGDTDAKRFLGLACAVAAGIIIGRPIAGLVAEPAGSLFFPRSAARPEPGYSLPDTLRKRGQYEQALTEYAKITVQFPAELRAYIAMMEIALVDLHDRERTQVIARLALGQLADEPQRMELLRVHRMLASRENSPSDARVR
jgi:hypothetical protein